MKKLKLGSMKGGNNQSLREKSSQKALSLFSLIESNIEGKWDIVVKRLKSHPQEASLEDEDSRSPLILACIASDLPKYVFQTMLEVYPLAASKADKNGSYPIHFYLATGGLKSVTVVKMLIEHCPSALLSRNKFGNTPLQVAMESEALDDTSPDIRVELLKILIAVGPEAASIRNESGSFPLHFSWRDPTPGRSITQILLEHYPEAAQMKNAYGATPLFMAINWDAPIDLLDVLLLACPSAVTVKDKRGICSISSAWNLFVHEVRVKDAKNALLEKERVKNNRRALKMASTHLDLTGNAEDWWEKIQLLLKAAYHNSVDDPLPGNKKWRVLHATAGSDCPSELLRLVLKLCRVQLFIKDEDNRLPLHIAAAAPLYIKQPFESHSDPVICKLASTFPDGALEVDKEGRLPLHIALDHHKTWNDGVSRLLQLHPQTARVCDPKTRLYPFMLAAIGDSESKIREECSRIAKATFKSVVWKKIHSSRKDIEIQKVIAKNDIDKITTIYQLLLHAPDLINAMNSSYDKVKEKEKNYLKMSNKILEEEYIEMLKDADTLKDMLDQRRAKSWIEINDLENKLNSLREEERRLTSRWIQIDERDDVSPTHYEF